jgi:hypothetical protein
MTKFADAIVIAVGIELSIVLVVGAALLLKWVLP